MWGKAQMNWIEAWTWPAWVMERTTGTVAMVFVINLSLN